MNKDELKKILKPLIKQCIKEVIFEEGILSGIISSGNLGIRQVGYPGQKSQATAICHSDFELLQDNLVR